MTVSRYAPVIGDQRVTAVEKKKQPGAYRELLQTFAKIANDFDFFFAKSSILDV